MKGINFEFPRKLWHCSSGFLGIFLYAFGIDVNLVIAVCGTGLILFGIEEIYRVNNPHGEWAQRFRKIMKPLMRDHEVYAVNGSLYYLLGLVATLIIYPKDVATTACLYMQFADPLASFAGRLYGKYTFRYPNGRSVAGTLASTITGLLTTYYMYGFMIPRSYAAGYHDSAGHVPTYPGAGTTLSLHGLAAIMAVAVGFSESFGIPGTNLDDNLVMPLMTGAILHGVIQYFKVVA